VLICACCSEGSHTVDRRLEAGQQTVLLAAPEARARELLDEWVSGGPADRAWNDLRVPS
jgi:hypothetical protein